MAKFSEYPEEVGANPEGFLLMAVEQPPGSPSPLVTKKIRPDRIGAQGPTGPQGLPGSGGTGPAGAPGTNGTNGINGAAGAAGAAGQPGYVVGAGISPTIGDYDGMSVDFFEEYPLGAITSTTGGVGWNGNGRIVNGTIISRTTHGGFVQNRLSLASNAQIGRRLPWVGKWNRVRVAILARVNSGAGIIDGTFAFGVNSGTAAMYGDFPGTTNWIGTAQYDTGVWSFTAGTQQNTMISTSYETVWRRGATDTPLAGSFTVAPVGFPASEPSHTMFVLDLERAAFTGGTGLTYTLTHNTTSTNTRAQFHHTRSAFLHLLNFLAPQVESPTLLLNSGNYTNGGGAIVSETLGAFDTFNFWWNSATPIEIVAMGAYKHY